MPQSVSLRSTIRPNLLALQGSPELLLKPASNLKSSVSIKSSVSLSLRDALYLSALQASLHQRFPTN